MLRANLATRPFYNERAIHLLLAAAAVIVLAITVWNVSRIVTLSRHSTELSARTNAERSEASRLSTEAVRIRRTINKEELTLVVNAAQEANALIDQRTFSWTEFFNQIEATIPPDVMLTSVRPSFKDGVTSVAMIVLGRQIVDIDEFIEKLETTGYFEDLIPASSEKNDDGLWRATINSVYVGNVGATQENPSETPPAATPSKAASPGESTPGRGDQPASGKTPPPQPSGERGRQ
jgi:type IV pilus assembly protein PilN